MHVVWEGVASQRRLDVGHEPAPGKATSQRQGGRLHLVSQADASGSESGEQVTRVCFGFRISDHEKSSCIVCDIYTSISVVLVIHLFVGFVYFSRLAISQCREIHVQSPR